jgi:hypothetical protein
MGNIVCLEAIDISDRSWNHIERLRPLVWSDVIELRSLAEPECQTEKIVPKLRSTLTGKTRATHSYHRVIGDMIPHLQALWS